MLTTPSSTWNSVAIILKTLKWKWQHASITSNPGAHLCAWSWMPRKQDSFGLTAEADWMMTRKQRTWTLTHHAVFHHLIWFVTSVFSWTADLTRLNMSHPRPEHAFLLLCRIRQVRLCVDETCRRILVQALVISLLDYCNSVLYGLPSSTLQPLSSVLHTAVRLIKELSFRDHITPTLKEQLWLPIHARIAFKISLLMYHIHSRTSPSYLSI